MDLYSMRKEFGSQLDYQLELPENPFDAFRIWFKEARKFYKEEANCFVISTADKKGLVSSRVVLLKDFDDENFTFFTNYESEKARCIEENSYVSCLFYWSSLEKQIRIQAKATKSTKSVSQKYFSSRPRNSQISSWASRQSSDMKDKKILVSDFNKYKEEFAKSEKIPCPEFWGGYDIKPISFEFWEGGLYRLHDRLAYKLNEKTCEWTQKRLAP